MTRRDQKFFTALAAGAAALRPPLRHAPPRPGGGQCLRGRGARHQQRGERELSVRLRTEGERNVAENVLAIELREATGKGAARKLRATGRSVMPHPSAATRRPGSRVSFALPAVPGAPTFTGTVSSDATSITGPFSQAGQSFPFELERPAAPVERADELVPPVAQHVPGELELGSAGVEPVGELLVGVLHVAEVHVEVEQLLVEVPLHLRHPEHAVFGRLGLSLSASRNEQQQQADQGAQPPHFPAGSSPRTGMNPSTFENAKTKPPALVSMRKPTLPVRSIGISCARV